MPTSHPDFPQIQRRLRRLDPTWYPARLAVDDEWGPGMAAGIDAALTALEQSHGLGPLAPPAPKPPAAASGKVPAKFSFLLAEPIPPLMVRVAMDLLGTLEAGGAADNPVILGWADEVAKAAPSAYNSWAADFYNKDSIAWCGLFMAVVAVRASQGRPERMPPDKYLAALSWANWGVAVPIDQAAVGDVMVLTRNGGGHVTLNAGTAKGGKSFFGIGGNQSDRVNFAEFDIGRVYAVRRPPYSALPPGARRVLLSSSGVVSTNEA